MTYKIKFLKVALKEWRSLDSKTQTQLKKKLQECAENPRKPATKLIGSQNRYKIKLRAIGYRLVYEVVDDQLVIIVVAIGRRDKNKVYKMADKRLI